MTRMGCNPEVQAWGVSAKSGKLELSGRAQRPDRGETGASDQPVRSRDALHDAPFYQHRLDPPERMLGIRRHHEQVDLLRVDVVAVQRGGITQGVLQIALDRSDGVLGGQRLAPELDDELVVHRKEK